MDDGRMELRHWANFDQNHLRHYFRDHPALKFMDVVAERDAAFAEREIALTEKKTVNAERDAALLQRDVAYADRNTAWRERDSALAALTVARSNKDPYVEAAAGRVMHMMNMAVTYPIIEPNLLTLPRVGNVFDMHMEPKVPVKQLKEHPQLQEKKPQDNPRKRKQQNAIKVQKSASNKQQLQLEGPAKMETSSPSVAPYDVMSISVPYCSCTGNNQQCYRWGSGGWQSACCTKFLSQYPLPMNPAKRGSRVAGRKMSGGAFKKLLERLAGEGVDIRLPIDLKNHWAKHGTNRYVTIK